MKRNKSNDICNQCIKSVETQFLRQRIEGPAIICDLCIEDLFSDDYKIISSLKLIAYLVARIFRAHSVRCMHALIGKFPNLYFGILKKSEVLGLRGLKVRSYLRVAAI